MNSLRRSVLLFGRCMTPDRPNALKVCVNRYEMDQRLTMYFREKEMYYAEDPKNQCQPGDYVIIRAIENPKSTTVTHRVEQLVYQLGNIIDPVTGKRCAGSEYIDDIKRTCEFFGTMPEYLKEGNDSVVKQVEK